MDSDPISSSPVKRRRIDNDDYGDDLFGDADIDVLDFTQPTQPRNVRYGTTQPTQIIDRNAKPQPLSSQILVPRTSPPVVVSSPSIHNISSPPTITAARLAPSIAPPGTGFRPPISLQKASQRASQPQSSQTFHDPPLLDSDSDDDFNRSRSEIKPTNFKVPGQGIDDFRAKTAQFAYNPSSAVPLKRPADDMVSAYGNSSRGTARPVARPIARQNGPARAMPVMPKITSLDDIPDWEHREKVKNIQMILPGRSINHVYRALIAKRFNVDDALDVLAEKEESIDLTNSDDELTFSPLKKNAAASVPKPTNKREATGTKNMMQKYSKVTQKPATETSPVKSSQPAKPLRRLKRGVRTRSSSPPEPVAIDISSSEAEETDEEEEANNYLSGLAIEDRVLKWLNSCTERELIEISNCKPQDAGVIMSKRPFKTLNQVRKVAHENAGLTKTGKKRAPPKPFGDRIIDICIEVHEGLDTVDQIVAECEKFSNSITSAIEKWGIGNTKSDDGVLDLTSLGAARSPTHDSGMGTPTSQISSDERKSKMDSQIAKGKFLGQPKIMSEDLKMKDYQLVGLNWLNLLYSKRLSCILADDMGLGKTCQVISFVSHLFEKGEKGPHLVVVPASTLENWLREFQKFSPELVVEPYHGPKSERPDYAARILDERDSINVVVTTYDMAAVADDNKFMRQLRPTVAVFDEGHTLKNPDTKRYQQCMRIPAKFRLMLTGTPLQNNLQELVSVLGFLQPELFGEHKEELNKIFKHKARTTDSDHAALLSAQRIARARSMITPFILRRKKAVVLKDLPKKTCRVEYCDLEPKQKEIYDWWSERHQEHLAERAEGVILPQAENWLMKRRQAAIHPLLFRWFYFGEEKKLETMAKLIPKKSNFNNWSEIKLKEALEWYSDFALHKLCLKHNNLSPLKRMMLKNDEWMQSGKVSKLKELLLKHVKNGDRTLLFSQFTSVLDILESVLETLSISFCRIDGATAIERRQELIDAFYDDTSIKVFMLSTRSGGTGINLACANKVIIFDSSFNPQDDIQAENRAHRVGQTRDVEVIRLVTRGTVEEQIHALGQTKMALDDRVAGDAGETGAKGKEDAAYAQGEALVEQMLLKGDVPAAETIEENKLEGEENGTADLKDQFLDGMKSRGVKIAA